MKPIIMAFLLVLTLSGCASSDPVVAVQTEQLQLTVPQELLEPVEPIMTIDEWMKKNDGSASIIIR